MIKENGLNESGGWNEGKFKEEIGEEHMGWSRRTNMRRKYGKESRCPERGGEIEARKTEIAMGDCVKIT